MNEKYLLGISLKWCHDKFNKIYVAAENFFMERIDYFNLLKASQHSHLSNGYFARLEKTTEQILCFVDLSAVAVVSTTLEMARFRFSSLISSIVIEDAADPEADADKPNTAETAAATETVAPGDAVDTLDDANFLDTVDMPIHILKRKIP